MNRSKKLLAMVIVLAVFVAAYLITSLVVKKQDEKAAVTETEGTFTVCEFTVEDIAQMQWIYDDAEYSVTRTEEGWTLDSDPGFRLDSDTVTEMAETLVAITASRKLEGGVELSTYGFDSPEREATIVLNDGSAIEFKQGDQNAVTSEYYLYANGSVYTVTDGIKAIFGKGLQTLYVYDEIPDMSDIVSLQMETADGCYTIVKLDDSSDVDYSASHTYFEMSGEEAIALDAELTEALFEEVTTFSWANMYAYDASDEDINETYGFETPLCRFTVTYRVTGEAEDGSEVSENREFAFEIGGEYSSYYYYTRLPGSDIIYRVNDDLGDLAKEFTVESYMDTDVLGLHGLSDLTITYAGTEIHMYYTSEEEVYVDDEGNETTNTLVSFFIGENEITEDEFVGVTASITALTATGMGDESKAGDEVISVTVPTGNDKLPSVTLTFAEYDATSYLCLRSDGRVITVDAGEIDSLVRSVKALIK